MIVTDASANPLSCLLTTLMPTDDDCATMSDSGKSICGLVEIGFLV